MIVSCPITLFLSLSLSHTHTHIRIHSIRSPGPVAPEDVECEGFDVTYTRIAGEKQPPPSHHRTSSSSSGGNHNNNVPSSVENDIHQKVDAAIENFLKNLSQIGPELLSVRDKYIPLTYGGSEF